MESVSCGGHVMFLEAPLYAGLFSYKKQPPTACYSFLFTSPTPLSRSLTHSHHNKLQHKPLSLSLPPPTCTNTTQTFHLHNNITPTQTPLSAGPFNLPPLAEQLLLKLLSSQRGRGRVREKQRKEVEERRDRDLGDAETATEKV